MLLPAARDEVQDVFCIHVGLKDRSFAYELTADFVFGKPLLLCKDPLLLFKHYQYDFQHRRWLKDNGEPVADQPEDET